MNIAIKQFKCKSQLLTQKDLTRKCIKNECSLRSGIEYETTLFSSESSLKQKPILVALCPLIETLSSHVLRSFLGFLRIYLTIASLDGYD